MATKYVFARSTTSTGSGDGRVFQIREGEVWAADDPLVKANPDLFSDEPTKLSRSSAVRSVEQATAAPGEVRNVKRSK